MQDENPKKALKWMHQAVPLMLQLDVVPTPYNYGIWYEYVSNRNKKLNQLMDNTLRKLGSIPSFLSRDFFYEFILSNNLNHNDQHQQRIEHTIRQLKSSSGEMTLGLKSLDGVLNASRKVMKHIGNQEPSEKEAQINKIIKYLDSGTSKALKSSSLFAQSLQQAQEEIQQLKQELAELKSKADLDPLTSLDNKVAFERHLYNLLPTAEDDISMIMLDIDGLNGINTRHGKSVGTSVIRYLANFLQSIQPEKTVTIARIYGGCFGLLLNESTLDMAHECAERIRNDIAQQKVRHKQSKESISQITVSIGVATLIGQEGAESLMLRANKNLARAKESGKNVTYSH